MRINQKSKREDAVVFLSSHAVKADDLVPTTGLYEITHQNQHCETEEVILITGDHFPDCIGCSEGIRFRLLMTAPYILHDKDFAPAA